MRAWAPHAQRTIYLVITCLPWLTFWMQPHDVKGLRERQSCKSGYCSSGRVEGYFGDISTSESDNFLMYAFLCLSQSSPMVQALYLTCLFLICFCVYLVPVCGHKSHAPLFTFLPIRLDMVHVLRCGVHPGAEEHRVQERDHLHNQRRLQHKVGAWCPACGQMCAFVARDASMMHRLQLLPTDRTCSTTLVLVQLHAHPHTHLV